MTQIRTAFLFFILMAFNLSPILAQNSDFDLIKKQVYNEYQKSTNTKALDENVAKILDNSSENGSWSNINYKDESLTSWQPDRHIKRLGKLAIAYTRTDSKYFQDQKTYTQIISAMNYWTNLTPEPKSENWWWTSISVPKEVGKLLITMRYGDQKVPEQLEKAMIQWMNKTVSISTAPGKDGSNLTDIAQHMIMQAVLIEDPALLTHAVDVTSKSIVITTGEGIQRDLSFHAHGPELYMHGYGKEYLSGIRNVEVYVQGTSFSFSSDQIALISDFARNGYLAVIRGKYLDYSVIGRSIANKNGTKATSGLVKQLRDIDLPEHQEEYDAAIARINETQAPSFGVKPKHTHYWRSDYSVHTRPEFMVTVNIASSRTIRTESGNGQNLNGQFLTEGAMYIAAKGDEYYNVFSNWEWNKIPGTTTPENKKLRKRTNWVAELGNADFVGGVSDGKNGVSVYNMDAYNTKAKKSWFFFEDVIICLGSDISADRPENITTSINQSRLRGPVKTIEGNSTNEVKNPKVKLNGTQWILHDGIGYYFPENQEISLSTQSETGAWSEINSNSSKAPVTQGIFKLWINHGLNPKGANYSYMLLPGVPDTQELLYKEVSSIAILSNTDKVQAVHDKRNRLLGFVFYEKGSFYWDGNALTISEPGLVQIQEGDSGEWEVSFAEPTQLRKGSVKIELSINGKSQGIEFKLPEQDYAGSTVSEVIVF